MGHLAPVMYFFDGTVGVGETKVKGVDFPQSFGIGKQVIFFILYQGS